MTVDVQRAAQYLDYFHPGWFYQVDPNTLDLSSCLRCVLGQTFKLAVGEWSATNTGLFDGIDYTSTAAYDRCFHAESSPLGFSRGVFASNDLYLADWRQAVSDRLAWHTSESRPCVAVEALAGGVR